MGTRFTQTCGEVQEVLTGLVGLVAGGERGTVQTLGESTRLTETGGGVEEELVGLVALKADGEGGASQAFIQGA